VGHADAVPPGSRIWFNRTYATNHHFIGLLRANPDGRALHILGTHTDPDSPVLAACDETYPEPDLASGPSRSAGAAYVDWALGFAREHEVQLLVPRAHMADLADARDRFAEIGTRLLCADGDTVRRFADKPSGYQAAADLGLPVPPYQVVTDAAGLRSAFAGLSEVAEQVCVKPVRGAGGDGFRRLTTAPPRLSDFDGQVRSAVRLDDLCAALDSDGPPHPALLVAPFLDGVEISVDVVATAGGQVYAAVGRQLDRRRRHIVDDAPAREVAEALITAHRIGYLSNTQVRYWQGPGDARPRPYLIEVNTRAAGGLFQTRLAGVNLPWAAVQLGLGEVPPPPQISFGAAYVGIASFVELPGVS
jgi:biotin carboxylase